MPEDTETVVLQKTTLFERMSRVTESGNNKVIQDLRKSKPKNLQTMWA
jgi:hypothetical protein